MAIVSFLHEFVFIKNLKTAGTSIEVHLAQDCGTNDILTAIYPEVHGHKPMNHLAEDGSTVFYNHMSAVELRERVPDAFDRFYKFCFERHPVDKCISHFAMLMNSPLHRGPENPGSWEEYLERGSFPVDVGRYTDGRGRSLVDRIYKYEELDDAMRDIAAKVGLTARPLIVREKSGFRIDVPAVADVMASTSQRNMIFDAFSETLRFVDY
jgi:hypothetical protein